ncbi:MAG: tetratricopeptide repeat protein [Flavobacterium sp.]|nr:tetratricopeptide repeat protein [Flavobacterium sp.]
MTKPLRFDTPTQTAVFCGAGISYHSGLPIVKSLLGKILDSMGIEESEGKIILESDMPFEYFMETIMNEVVVDDLLDIYNNGEPNATHHYIAALVKSGTVKTIMTTNFDQLIEKALVEEGIVFKVFADESSFETIDWRSLGVKVIKIHGCVSDKDRLGITMRAVAGKGMCKGKNSAVSNFFSKGINPNILVMGYSCSDLFDISPLIEEISTERGSNIHFIEHTNSNDIYIENIGLKIDKNPFKNFNGKRFITNTDSFVRDASGKLDGYKYEFISATTSWEENVTRWLLGAIEENTCGVVHQIPARLFDNIGAFILAKKHFEASMMTAYSAGNQIMFYSEMGNLAVTLASLGNYKEARKMLEESTIACKDLGNVDGEITQLQALGNVYRNLSDFELAIAAYDSAIRLCENERDIWGLCNSLGNAASAYNHTGRPDKAIEYLDNGLGIAIAIGDKQSEGSMMCSFGFAYAQKGEKLKAAEYIQKSIEITKMLNDKKGECIALHNLSNIYLGFEDYKECRKVAFSALEIAMAIHSVPNIARAQYNIGSSYLFTKGEAKTALGYFYKALENNLKVFEEDSREHMPMVKGIIEAKLLLGIK